MERIKRALLSWLGYYDWPDDLEDEVPDDIGITGPVLSHGEFGNRYWYITATYGTGDDHQHIEIKLDRDRYDQLCESIVSGETPSGAPTPSAPAAPSAEPAE